jgi:charged multivesicular body protein 7
LDEASRVATSNTSRIFTTELFASTFAPAIGVNTLSSNDLSVLLTHLARDRSAIAFSSASQTVKFKSPSEPEPSPITPEDANIASIRALISSIEPQIQQLTSRLSEFEKAARDAVAKKNNIAAKSALRSKKLTDTKLQQRITTLTQLEDVYAKIEQAADQVEMVRIMELSSQTLGSLNQKTGGVERVQDVMEELRNQMMDVDEVTSVINEESAGKVDEGEVEDELEAMENVEREKVEAAERKEREAKEAKEAELQAEETKRRLAELGTVGEKQEEAAPKSAEPVANRELETEHAS